MFGKIVKWGTLGATVGVLIMFRGDIQRYIKMKRMQPMHELSIAMSIVDGVLEEAARHGGARVDVVYLRLGALSGVDKDALRFSYEVASQETPLARSRLLIEDIEVIIDCPTCGTERPVRHLPVLACAACGSIGTRVVRGEELEIVRLEIAA